VVQSGQKAFNYLLMFVLCGLVIGKCFPQSPFVTWWNNLYFTWVFLFLSGYWAATSRFTSSKAFRLISALSLVCLMALCVVLRMTVLDSAPYRTNAMMNANFFALGMAFVIFALFNVIFVGGFFKTAYKIGKPFVTFIVVSLLVTFVAEALHHIPGLERVNAFCTDDILLQLLLLLAGIIIYFLITLLSYKRSCRNFERIDI
jgi:hypothetical protein